MCVYTYDTTTQKEVFPQLFITVIELCEAKLEKARPSWCAFFYNKLTTQLALAICEKNKNRKIFRKGRCCWLKYEVPIWEKANLTFEEAAAYFGIGINRLRDLTSNDYCPYVWWIGSKRLIKRRAFERYLETAFSVWFLYFAVENGAWMW